MTHTHTLHVAGEMNKPLEVTAHFTPILTTEETVRGDGLCVGIGFEL